MMIKKKSGCIREDLKHVPPHLESIVLYPMNALVNDQLTRLRRILHWEIHRHGREQTLMET
jgi:ATP-dependent helicase YprA (DUF1998 family)